MEVVCQNSKKHPRCPHGPCLMYKRYSANEAKTGKPFYACSACRRRTECDFFLWADEPMSDQLKNHWENIIKKSKPSFTHEACMERLVHMKKLKKYCRTCSQLLLSDEAKGHLKHDVISNVDLQNPSSLFEPLENKVVQAQYFFTKETTMFVVDLLQRLNFTKCVAIGCPKIHEFVTSHSNMNSLLLDIDHRYMHFFNQQQFCHYNLFNNHFFDGKASRVVFESFLTEKENEKVVILLDPPFGGLVDSICWTLKEINARWKKVNEKDSNLELPLLWFFPYFHEERIIGNMSNLVMMDYKVEYSNHRRFRNVRNQKSPVRIFTNINSKSFILPKEGGYKFCEKCMKYASPENQHCEKCDACTTKHGKTYRHCDKCGTCRKNVYEHCDKCKKCLPVSHSCDYNPKLMVCYACSGIGHKKRECPDACVEQKKKRKKK